MRSPEIAAHGWSCISLLVLYTYYPSTVVAEFLKAYQGEISEQAFASILKSILSGAKSSNLSVRHDSCTLFSILVNHKGRADASVETAVNEVLALPKASKTSGAEHRIALYEMLHSIKPASGIAQTISKSLPLLLTKETNEVAIPLLAQTLALQLTYLLEENVSVDQSITNAIAKEMSSTKPVMRRAFCTIAGNSLWSISDKATEAGKTFASSILQPLENSLKIVAANPLMASTGPFEGYMSFALMLGPLSRLGIQNYGTNTCFTSSAAISTLSPVLDSVVSKNAVIQAILASTTTKPHFLLWNKCYQKLTTLEEELWLLRALEVGISHFRADIRKSEVLR